MAGPGELWPLTAAGCGVVNAEAFARLHVRKRGARSTGNPLRVPESGGEVPKSHMAHVLSTGSERPSGA